MIDKPRETSHEWWDSAKNVFGVEPGMPFPAKLYGETNFQLKHHRVLHLVWLMLSEIHRLLWAGLTSQSLAQVCQCLRAVGTCGAANRNWKGAWEYTLLPESGRTDAGVSPAEKASLSRHLCEQATIEKICEDAK